MPPHNANESCYEVCSEFSGEREFVVYADTLMEAMCHPDIPELRSENDQIGMCVEINAKLLVPGKYCVVAKHVQPEQS